jgi:Uma2 family endonuclease
MSTQPKPYLTPEQYLEVDRAAERRSEYYNGEMFPMSAVSVNHTRIVTNLTVLLSPQLRKRSCELAGSDLRIRTGPPPHGPYFYPDLVVFCGKPQLEDLRRDTLTDAIVIFEVLSPSTERYDRTFKFEHYRTLASLKDYILIAQDQVRIEHKARLDDGSWERRETLELEGLIELPSIGCAFRVADAYELVEFTETE